MHFTQIRRTYTCYYGGQDCLISLPFRLLEFVFYVINRQNRFLKLICRKCLSSEKSPKLDIKTSSPTVEYWYLFS